MIRNKAKGLLFFAFSTLSKSAIRKFQETKRTQITEEGVKPSLYADKKKKKKLGGSTVKFSCFVGSKLMYKNRPYFYIIGSELLKTEIKKCHSYENRR